MKDGEPEPVAGGKAVSRVRHRVIFADTDAMGIVYYGNYLRYFEIGRAEWFRRHLKAFREYIAQDSYLIVLECHCAYLRPARYDQVIVIETSVGDVDRAKVRIDYVIRDDQETVLAEGYTSHTVVDGGGRIKRMPPDFIRQLKALAGAD